MIDLVFKSKNGAYFPVSVDKIMKEMGFEADPEYCGVRITRGEQSLTASAWDGKYAEIDVTGKNSQYGPVYDLSASSIDRRVFETFLYAGNSDLESDCEIAMVSQMSRNEDDDSRRVLFYDPDLCHAEPYDGWDPDKMAIASTEDMMETIR